MTLCPNYLFFIFVFIFGACMGSFYNVLIYRIPRKESIIFPGSHCPGCSTNLKWYDNIPLISYILLGAKCRYCRTRISWQYPAVELFSAIAALYCGYRWGMTLQGLFVYLFVSVLLVVSVIDLRNFIIPDVISIPGMVLFLLLSLLRPQITFWESLLGLLIGGGVIYAVIVIYYLFTKREGMGGGDIKLLALIGAFLGYKSLLFVLLAASLCGSVIGIIYMIAIKGDRKLAVPFGPFLSFGAMLYLCCGPELIYHYKNWLLS